MRALLLLAALAFPCHAAQEFFIQTGNDLLRECSERSANKEACRLYLFGVIDGISAGIVMYNAYNATKSGEKEAKLICGPLVAPYSQSVDIILKHLTERPETRHQQAVPLAVIALRNAFPCK